MQTKMHAAVVTAFGQPLGLREWDVAVPGPRQILVRTEACGVCHTDLHAAKGDWPLKLTPPFIPGHEAIGLVVALGSGLTIVNEGDRVGVPRLYSACGNCEYCLSPWETVCPEASSAVIPAIADSPNTSSPIPTMWRTSPTGSALERRRR